MTWTNPVGAAQRARQALKPDGSCIIVNTIAGDRVQDNINPVDRIFHDPSSLICVPISLARKGPAIGAQAAEARLRDIVGGGARFTRMRRATKTPFSIVLEALPLPEHADAL